MPAIKNHRPGKRLGKIPVPTVPMAIRGMNGRGAGANNPIYRKFVDVRNAFAVKALAAGYTLEDAAKALTANGHVVTNTGIHQSLDKHNLLPKNMTPKARGPITRAPKLAKHNHEDAKAMMGFLDELVEKRLAPMTTELQRLSKIEKQYNALVKATRLLAEVTSEKEG